MYTVVSTVCVWFLLPTFHTWPFVQRRLLQIFRAEMFPCFRILSSVSFPFSYLLFVPSKSTLNNRSNIIINRMFYLSAVYRVFLADRTTRSVIRYWYHNVVCLSVCASWLIDTSCLNRWIGSALLGTWRYNFQRPIHRPWAVNSPSPKFPTQYDRLSQQQLGFLLFVCRYLCVSLKGFSFIHWQPSFTCDSTWISPRSAWLASIKHNGLIAVSAISEHTSAACNCSSSSSPLS